VEIVDDCLSILSFVENETVFMNRYWVLFIILFCELYHIVLACLDSKQLKSCPFHLLFSTDERMGNVLSCFFSFLSSVLVYTGASAFCV
jgi:hypothetical protein